MRTKAFNPNAIALSIMCSFSGISSLTYAQTPSSSTSSEPAKMQTVTVTAERPTGFKASTVQVGAFRDQEMLDVPLTVNIVPAAVLEAQDSRGVFDALRNTAGVTRAQLSGAIYDNLAIRGISLQNRTNYRLNGSLPIINLIDMPLENKERVEALKGASSMYYGFTTPVGVINLVTKRALRKPVSNVSISGNEYGQLVEHVDLGRTFGAASQFGARVNVVSGKLRNATEGTTGSRSLATAALDWRVSSSLTLAFDYEDIQKKITEPAAIVIPAAVGGVISLPKIPDPRKLVAGNWPENDALAKNALLRADYTINDSWYALAEVGRAQTRRDKRDYSEITNYKLDTGEGPLNFSLTRGLNFVNRNVRLEVGGRVNAFSMTHDLTFGVMNNKLYQAGPNSQAFSIAQNLYNPRPVAFIAKTSPTIFSPINTDDRGIYAMNRMTAGDFQFTVAVRNEDYETVTVRNTVTPSVTTRYTATPTTYSYSALYKVRKDTSLYASYIEGLEEGPVAPTTAANPGAILPPAVSKQTELGLRSEAIAGMMGSIAYFQIERATSYTDANRFVVLDGRTQINGFEASLAGEVNRELSIYTSAMVIDPTLKRAATAALTGKTPDNTPKITFSVLLDYKPQALPGLSANIGAYYTGKRYINPLNQAEIPDYTTLTAGLGYKTKLAGYPLSLQANVSNLTNKRFWEAGGAGYLAVSAPRTVSFTSKVEF
jgi:iron complex outermembrane receptor protein